MRRFVGTWYGESAVPDSWAMGASEVKKPRAAKTTVKLRKSLAHLTEKTRENPLKNGSFKYNKLWRPFIKVGLTVGHFEQPVVLAHIMEST